MKDVLALSLRIEIGQTPAAHSRALPVIQCMRNKVGGMYSIHAPSTYTQT